MSEPDLILCVPVESGGVVYPGSRQRPCVDCGRDVWASPASLEAIRSHDAVLICLVCGADRWERGPHPESNILPGTAAELAAYLRRN